MKVLKLSALAYVGLAFVKYCAVNPVPSFVLSAATDKTRLTGQAPPPPLPWEVVRATSIFKKAAIDPDTFWRDIAGNISAGDLGKFLEGENADEFWELWLAAAKTSYIVDQCISTTEPAYLAKHAFHLAQLFNTFYHRHPILSESDEKRKQFLLATVAVVRRELIRTLAVMGITVPPVM